ncbi:hypothetical protein CAAN1_02S09252 [[Candida] anglica]|uniref:TauD/TfdA-like domain-containing protein n=1 Tax=[Candida] anglica TaxID=148631 RepID=A0ABP0EGD8_9ASCO
MTNLLKDKYSEGNFTLVKLPLDNSYLVNGNEFPVAFKFTSQVAYEEQEVIKFLSQLASKNVFNELQDKHGAVVIRNLGTKDPQVLSKYIEAIQVNSSKKPFIQCGALAKRRDIAPYLQTANEGDPRRRIHQHNEFSRFKKYPNHLVFVNIKYSAQNGETPIVHCGELYNRLYAEIPEFLSDLKRKGLYMTQTWPYNPKDGITWVDKFSFGKDIEATDSLETKKSKAELVLQERISSDFEWLSNNDLKVHQHTQPLQLHKTGIPVLFSSLPTYYNEMKNSVYDEDNPPIAFDNKELIQKSNLEKVFDISTELEYLHDWEEGDIALIDNHQVSHGRRPWKEGEREVLVSMWE